MKKSDRKKQRVVMRRINWDAEFYKDIRSGKSFVITEPAEINLDGNRKKSLYGPQSPLYGTSYEDEQSFVERYRCKCGAFTSRIFEGETCPVCNTKVEYQDSDINIFGWISLGDNRILSPYYYRLLKFAIGDKVFPDITYARYKITTDGKRIRPRSGDMDESPSSIYAGKGVDFFYQNYDEILDYFKEKRKNKAHVIDTLKKEKHQAFVSHIPIPSTLLRPQSITSDSFYYQSIDKLVNTSFSLSEELKRCLPVERDYLINRLQTKVNAMWDIYFNELNGKDQLIRGELLGGSLNFTSRNVICPDPTLRADEVDLSYYTFLELYKYRIIYYLMKLEDITLAKAYSMWRRAGTFSEKIYQIMQFIIQRNDTRVVINRNPTLNYYSMLLMRVRQVKHDPSDYALSVPLSILSGLNADFDGDILNIIAMTDIAITYIFRKFDPVRRMIISRDTGGLNPYFSLQKGQLIDLYYFCTIGKKENDEPQTYPVKDNDTGEIIYVEEGEIKKYKSGRIPTKELPLEIV